MSTSESLRIGESCAPTLDLPSLPSPEQLVSTAKSAAAPSWRRLWRGLRRRLDDLVEDVFGPACIMMVLFGAIVVLVLWFVLVRIVLTLVRY